jgi:hypothetical protein
MSDWLEFEDSLVEKDVKKTTPTKEAEASSVLDNIDELMGITPVVVPDIMGDSEFPKLMGSGYPPDFLELVEMIKANYSKLPKIDVAKIFSELKTCHVTLSTDPTLSSISKEIQMVQAAKERVSYIITEVMKAYFFKKRAVDILSDSWGKFTSEKNAEARKGDCVYRLSDFERDYAEVEMVWQTCNNVITNLDGSHQALSRRVTLAQLQLRIRELNIPEKDILTYTELDGTMQIP